MADFNHAYIGRLVVKSQNGDSDAFAELYAITYQHTYNYAAHYLRDTNLAQDALQETYILALRNISGIKEPALFVAWLNQICFRVCYDMERKNRQEYGENNPELLEFISDEYMDHIPEDMTETADEASRLKEAIMSLPFNEQQVVVMRYYNDMKLEEIASALSCSRSSVKRYLISAKDRLKSMLRKGDEDV